MRSSCAIVEMKREPNHGRVKRDHQDGKKEWLISLCGAATFNGVLHGWFLNRVCGGFHRGKAAAHTMYDCANALLGRPVDPSLWLLAIEDAL